MLICRLPNPRDNRHFLYPQSIASACTITYPPTHIITFQDLNFYFGIFRVSRNFWKFFEGQDFGINLHRSGK